MIERCILLSSKYTISWLFSQIYCTFLYKWNIFYQPLLESLPKWISYFVQFPDMTLNKYEGENFSWHHLSESEKTISTGSFRTPKIEGNKKGRGPFQQSHVQYLKIFQSSGQYEIELVHFSCFRKKQIKNFTTLHHSIYLCNYFNLHICASFRSIHQVHHVTNSCHRITKCH